MTKKIFLVLCLCLFSFYAQAGQVVSQLTPESLKITIDFDKGYSDVNVIKLDKSYIVSFQSGEDVVYSEEFWDSGVSQAYIHSEGERKKLIVDFTSEASEPKVETGEKSISVSFSFTPTVQATGKTDSGVYVRMITGLGFVIVLILIIYWLTRKILARRALSELPGTGRLLGKVDLEIRKSLYFYELGESVYIFGVTDMSVNLIEKITDEAEINRIKAGFSRKGDFGSYLNFFNKGTDVKGDLEVSRNIIREKMKSIKKR